MPMKTLRFLVLAVLPGVAAFSAVRALTSAERVDVDSRRCEPVDSPEIPATSQEPRREVSLITDDGGSGSKSASASPKVQPATTSPGIEHAPDHVEFDRAAKPSHGADLQHTKTLSASGEDGTVERASPFRAETSDEFKDPTVVQDKLSRAFDDLEFEIDVREVDCTDVPCIAYGELPLGDEYLEAAHSAALAEYGAETKILKMGARYGNSERQLFGFALLDPDATRDEMLRVAQTLNARNASYFRSSYIEDGSEER